MHPTIDDLLKYGAKFLPAQFTTEDGVCSCGNAKCRTVGKHPIGGLKHAKIDVLAVQKILDSARNIGVYPGEEIVVIDSDDDQIWDRWTAGQAMPPHPIVRSPRRGHHHYFRVSPGVGRQIRSRRIEGALDIRTGNAFVVLPTERNDYTWACEEPLPPAPEWIVERLLARSNGSPGSVKSTEQSPHVYNFEPGLSGAPGIGEGNRHEKAKQLIAQAIARAKTPNDVMKTVEHAIAFAGRCKPPMDSGEVISLVQWCVNQQFGEAEILPSDWAGELPGDIVIHGESLADINETPVDWLWHEMIPLGSTTIISGMPGDGKSMLGCSLAAHVTRGIPMFDGSDVLQGRVCIVGYEDSATAIKRRVKANGGDLDRVYWVKGVGRAGVLPEELEEFSIACLDQLPHTPGWEECRLLIIDPIADAIASLGRGDELNSYGFVTRLLGLTSRFARENNIAVIGIHHASTKAKPSGRALGKALGSTGWTSKPRVAYTMEPDRKNSNSRVLLCVKNNLDVSQKHHIRVDLDSDSLAISVSPLAFLGSADQWLEREATNARTETGSPERLAAAGFLKAQLSTGPVERTVLFEEGKNLGFSESTIKRAADDIGELLGEPIVIEKTGGHRGKPSVWKLVEAGSDPMPETAEKEDQAEPPNAVVLCDQAKENQAGGTENREHLELLDPPFGNGDSRCSRRSGVEGVPTENTFSSESTGLPKKAGQGEPAIEKVGQLELPFEDGSDFSEPSGRTPPIDVTSF